MLKARTKTKPSFSKRKIANQREQDLGIHGLTTAQAHDFFSNIAARTGLGGGSTSLENYSQYQVERWSLQYWPAVAMYETSWIARRIVEAPAEDMFRCWPSIQGETAPDDLAKIEKVIRKTNTRARLLEAIKWARLFGGAGALIILKGQEKELDQPLKLDDIELNSFRGVVPFDRWSGCTPTGDVCDDIESKDFGLPEFYDCRTKGGDSFKVHCSRIIRFTGPAMPSPEREAYSNWGISVLAPVLQAIVSYDNINANALSLTFKANILGMKVPALEQLLSGMGSSQQASQKFEQRMQTMNSMLSNQSMVLLPADGELSSTQYSFSGLAEMLQNYQLVIAGAGKMPITRLWGRTLSGLGQAGDGDERIYEETIATECTTTLEPALDKLLPIIAMSEIGEPLEDADLSFPSLRVLDEKEKAELAKATADTIVVYMNAGLISPRCAAKEIKQASVITGIGTNLTDEAIEKLSDDVAAEGELGEGLFGAGSGGLEPVSAPAKVVKEENHVEEETEKAEAQDGLNIPGLGRHNKVDPVKTQLKEDKKLYETYRTTYIKCGKPGGDFESWLKRLFPQDAAKVMAARAIAKDSDGPTHKEYDIHGLHIVIETPRGFTRTGETRSGESWSNTMPADYGFIQGVEGADGDSLDCYVSDINPASENVYIVDQKKLAGRGYDESKVIFGCNTMKQAKDLFFAGHHRATDVFGQLTHFPIADFKQWTATADLSLPCSEDFKC